MSNDDPQQRRRPRPNPPREPVGRVDDIKAIRALAHPLRLQIMDLLRDDGPLTATEVAKALANSTPNCAFHLRTLAKYGFIEEADGRDRRERPWQVKSPGILLDPATGGPEHQRAVQAATVAQRQIAMAKHSDWDRRESDATRAWRKAAFEMEYEGPMTPAELAAVSEAWQRAVMEILDRPDREVPKNAVRVHLRGLGFPLAPAPSKEG